MLCERGSQRFNDHRLRCRRGQLDTPEIGQNGGDRADNNALHLPYGPILDENLAASAGRFRRGRDVEYSRSVFFGAAASPARLKIALTRFCVPAWQVERHPRRYSHGGLVHRSPQIKPPPPPCFALSGVTSSRLRSELWVHRGSAMTGIGAVLTPRNSSTCGQLDRSGQRRGSK